MTPSRKLWIIALIAVTHCAGSYFASRVNGSEHFLMPLASLTVPIGVVAFVLAAYFSLRPEGSFADRFDAQLPPGLIGLLIGEAAATLVRELIPVSSTSEFQSGFNLLSLLEKLLIAVVPLLAATWAGSRVNRRLDVRSLHE